MKLNFHIPGSGAAPTHAVELFELNGGGPDRVIEGAVRVLIVISPGISFQDDRGCHLSADVVFVQLMTDFSSFNSVE